MATRTAHEFHGRLSLLVQGFFMSDIAFLKWRVHANGAK